MVEKRSRAGAIQDVSANVLDGLVERAEGRAALKRGGGIRWCRRLRNRRGEIATHEPAVDADVDSCSIGVGAPCSSDRSPISSARPSNPAVA